MPNAGRRAARRQDETPQFQDAGVAVKAAMVGGDACVFPQKRWLRAASAEFQG